MQNSLVFTYLTLYPFGQSFDKLSICCRKEQSVNILDYNVKLVRGTSEQVTVSMICI